MALKPGQPKRGQLSLSQFKESVATKRKIANLQKKQEEEPESKNPDEKQEPQYLNTGGYKAKQRPEKETIPPEKLQEMLENHSKVLEKHAPKINDRLKFLQKTRP